jgi:hypothetical protein
MARADCPYGFVPRAILAEAVTDPRLSDANFVASLLVTWDGIKFPIDHYVGLATNLIADPVIVLGPKALAMAISATFRPIALKINLGNQVITY